MDKKYTCLILDDQKDISSIFDRTYETEILGTNYTTGDRINMKTEDIDFTMTRTFEEAQDWVKQNGFPDILFLDEDLGWGITWNLDVPEKCGLSFMIWLARYDKSLNNNTDYKGNRFSDIKHFKSCSNHSFCCLTDTYERFYFYMSRVTGNRCDFDGVHVPNAKKDADLNLGIAYPIKMEEEQKIYDARNGKGVMTKIISDEDMMKSNSDPSKPIKIVLSDNSINSRLGRGYSQPIMIYDDGPKQFHQSKGGPRPTKHHGKKGKKKTGYR